MADAKKDPMNVDAPTNGGRPVQKAPGASVDPRDMAPPLDSNKPQEDLLTQISKSDIEAESAAKNKKQINLYEDFSKIVAQVNVFLSAQMKAYPIIVEIFRWVWGIFAAFILLGGIAAASILLYIYFSFPYFIKDYLTRNNAIIDDVSQMRFSFSDVEIHNVRGKDGSYTINRVLLRYTLSELLKRKIKSVTLDGVRIDVTEDKSGFNVGSLPGILRNILHPTGPRAIRIASLESRDVVLNVKGQRFNLPVSFSMTGVYNNGVPEVNISIRVREKNVNLDGYLSIQTKGGTSEWVLDLTSGTLNFPGRSPENVSGRVTFSTRGTVVTTIIGDLKSSYGANSKALNINLTRGSDNLFSGEVRLNWKEGGRQYEHGQAISSIMLARFDGLDLKGGIHRFETNKPVQLSIQSFQRGDMMLNNANVRLLGRLECQNFTCSYNLTGPSVVNTGSANFIWNNKSIRTDLGASFTLVPLKSGNIFEYKDGVVSLDLVMQRFRLPGYRDVRTNPISISADGATLKGVFDMNRSQNRLALGTDGMEYETADYALKGAAMSVTDVFDYNSDLRLTADSLVLKDVGIMKKPARIAFDRTKGLTRAQLFLEQDRIQLAFEGNMDYSNGRLDGSIYMKPVNLSLIKTPLSDISNLFPPNIKNSSGEMSAIGSVHWKNAKQVSGPVYVSLKNVGADIGNLTVGGLNAVLALSSLAPLTTQGSQDFVAERIDGPIPLRNVNMTAQLDNQFIYLTSFSGFMGNVRLALDSALIPFRAASTTLILRNSSVDLKDVAPYMTIPMSLTGKASISLPIDVRDGRAVVKGGEIKLLGTKISATKANVGVLSDLLTPNKLMFDVRNGLLLVNSAPNSNALDIQIILDERLGDAAGVKRSFRKTYRKDLHTLFKEVDITPIPEDIIERQKLFNF